MEDGYSEPDVGAMRARYEALSARVERDRRRAAGEGGGAVFAALAFGDAIGSNRRLAGLRHAAQLVCIAALGIFPIILVLRVLL